PYQQRSTILPLARNHVVRVEVQANQLVVELKAAAPSGPEQIAVRDKCSVRQVNMTISLAFLAPKLVQAAVEGRLPCAISVTRLRNAPADWSRQYAMLGLSI